MGVNIEIYAPASKDSNCEKITEITEYDNPELFKRLPDELKEKVYTVEEEFTSLEKIAETHGYKHKDITG